MWRSLEDGVYDHLLDEALAALAEEASRTREVDVADLDPARTPSFAAAHLRPLVERVLASVKGEDAADKQNRRVAILNRLLATLTEAAAEHCSDPPLDDGETRVPSPRHLRLVRPRLALGAAAPVILPETPLAESALLVNASGEPSLGRELTRELASADRVDLRRRPRRGRPSTSSSCSATSQHGRSAPPDMLAFVFWLSRPVRAWILGVRPSCARMNRSSRS